MIHGHIMGSSPVASQVCLTSRVISVSSFCGVTAVNPILQLQAFIDERWAMAQPRFYPAAAEQPRVRPELTTGEAEYFLASVTANDAEPPLIQVDDERKLRSDRFPPRRDGSPRGYLFFEEPGRLRLETIVHLGAAARPGTSSDGLVNTSCSNHPKWSKTMESGCSIRTPSTYSCWRSLVRTSARRCRGPQLVPA